MDTTLIVENNNRKHKPMTFKAWFQSREEKWQRLDTLSRRPVSGDELREMSLLYLETINDLARAQSQPEARHLEPYLNSLVQRCHHLMHERPPTRFSDIRRFFTTDFPQCFRRNWLYIALAFAMFLLGTVLALLTIHFHPEAESYFMPPAVIDALDQGKLWTDAQKANPSQSSLLMTNNIRVAINAFALGVFFGIGTLVLMLYNGLFAFGGPLAVCMAHGMGKRLLTFVAAHGVIELTTIFIAGGAGMMIGFALLFPGMVPRWQAMKDRGREALILITGCIPLLVIAGLIEGLVSLNARVGMQPRLLVAAASAIGLFIYLGFFGRKQSQEDFLLQQHHLNIRSRSDKG
jgi:uncharacterized membrane protein SpoIIM required for sporulation